MTEILQIKAHFATQTEVFNSGGEGDGDSSFSNRISMTSEAKITEKKRAACKVVT